MTALVVAAAVVVVVGLFAVWIWVMDRLDEHAKNHQKAQMTRQAAAAFDRPPRHVRSGGRR